MRCMCVASVAVTRPAAHGLYLPVRQSRHFSGGGGPNSERVAGIVVGVQPCSQEEIAQCSGELGPGQV